MHEEHKGDLKDSPCSGIEPAAASGSSRRRRRPRSSMTHCSCLVIPSPIFLCHPKPMRVACTPLISSPITGGRRCGERGFILEGAAYSIMPTRTPCWCLFHNPIGPLSAVPGCGQAANQGRNRRFMEAYDLLVSSWDPPHSGGPGLRTTSTATAASHPDPRVAAHR